MSEKPGCRYCGEPMKPDRTFKSMLPPGVPVDFWYLCGECCATSPRRATREEAYAAAMARYVEPNRVLTAEEVKRAWKRDADRFALAPMWYETIGGYVNNWVVMHRYALEENNMATYGIGWRCWLRRPTDEERAAPWENSNS